MCYAERVLDSVQAGRVEGGMQLRAHALRCIRIGEEDRAERHVRCAARDELEHVASSLYTTHADDRQLARAPARIDRCERDRFQRLSGVATRHGCELRSQV